MIAKSSSSPFLALTVALLLMSQALPVAHCARAGSPTLRLRAPPAMKAKDGRFGAASYQRAPPVLSDDSWTNPGPSPGKGHPGSNRHE
ncbi:unnamed protein product [Urochloa humidicola]